MRIAVSTSGGDAPGLNAVIEAVTKSAHSRGHEVVGLRRGFSSLLAGEEPIELTDRIVDGIEREGGTILGAESKGNPFRGSRGGVRQLVGRLKEFGVDALIMAGGDGTMAIAKQVHDAGFRVVGVPKTIDRDVCETATTFGFDTAVNTATEALDKLHPTAAAHSRVFTVQVMGRDAGWIALYSGIAGGACGIALPEVPFYPEVFAEHIRQREALGFTHHIIVVAEGARIAGADVQRSERTGRYDGIAETLATMLEELTGKEARSLSLGHLLRGGQPTTNDRILGLRFGSAAVSALDRGESGVMVAFDPPGFRTVPLERVAGRNSLVTPGAHELKTAVNMGISFGAQLG